MICGACPYCDEPWFQGMPPDHVPLPCVGRVECEECGKESWMLFSRLEPVACRIEDWKGPPAPFPGRPDVDTSAWTLKHGGDPR